ncbi:MAG: hypothetical protein H7338_17410 [Candidatus Sericytochromatia bacterium]|nr:hypothetical protein [Candidatus Sericytochromatia bacterium]
MGQFIAEQFRINAHPMLGSRVYGASVATNQRLPFLLLIELAIFVPLYLHAFCGLCRVAKNLSNLTQALYALNGMYSLQRWTGVIVLIFVTVHLWQCRFGLGWRFQDEHNGLVLPVWLGVGVVSVLATMFHFANVRWNFRINRGITVGQRAQLISSYVWTGAGLALSLFGLGSLRGFLS